MSVVVLMLFAGFAFYLYAGCKPVRQFDHLEENARKVITASELQTWATNLLASYPATNDWFILRPAQLGTNFPAQLLGLAPRLGPCVAVYFLDDRPRSLRVWWGSGFLGSTGFEIGSTNFVGDGHKWQDGVYFFSRH